MIPERRVGQAGGHLPLEQMGNLLIRLSDRFDSYWVFDWQKGVPWTNSGIEQAIRQMQMRRRSVRGHESWPGM